MERLLQDIIDILPVGVWVSDAQGRIVRNNPAAERIWSGAGPPADADSDRFRSVVATHPPAIRIAGLGHRQGTCARRVLHRTSGCPSSVSTDRLKTILHSAALLHDNQERSPGPVGISEDITAIKESEERWHRREQLLQTMIDLLPVGVWANDKRGRVTLVNPAASAIWSGHEWEGDIDPESFNGWWADTGKNGRGRGMGSRARAARRRDVPRRPDPHRNTRRSSSNDHQLGGAAA